MLKRVLVVGVAVGLLGAVACSGGPSGTGTPSGGGAAAATATPRPGGGASTPASGGSSGSTADADAGKNLFTAKGCVACHTVQSIPAARGTIGPDLTNIASKAKIAGDRLSFNDADLDKWLSNPAAVKPDTQMPSLGLSDSEKKQLIAFLKTLK